MVKDAGPIVLCTPPFIGEAVDTLICTCPPPKLTVSQVCNDCLDLFTSTGGRSFPVSYLAIVTNGGGCECLGLALLRAAVLSVLLTAAWSV